MKHGLISPRNVIFIFRALRSALYTQVNFLKIRFSNLLKLAARIPSFMYLTDFREQTIKDVITQLEPDLFKKVTGLTVKDFDILCEIGLFDPEKMNQGIFGFRRYENSSLNYTGIDMHDGEDVGGWDTVLKREEFDALYASQQATLSLQSAIMSAIDESDEDNTSKKTVTAKQAQSVPKATTLGQKYGLGQQAVNPGGGVQQPTQKPKEKFVIPDVKVGDSVHHKVFGIGTISYMDKAQKKIRVKFNAGEKVFIFPDAFVQGYISLEE